MGNNCCYAPVEYRNYKKAKFAPKSEGLKHFVWGCNRQEASFMYFVDIKSKKFQQLELPPKVPLYNFSGGLQINEDQIAICGGVSYSMRRISQLFYIYSIKNHKFRQMPSMLCQRFNISLVFIYNRLYSIGGRSFGNSEEAIKPDCEVFNFETNTWKKIAPMTVARSGCKSFVYRSKIYVVGGNNSEHKGNSIEFYEPQNDTWTVLELKLPFDYFNFGIFLGGPDEILIMGGAFCKGYMKNIHSINLKKETIINKGAFIAKRANFKYFYDSKKDELFVLGGVFNGSDRMMLFEFAEKYSFEKHTSHFIDFDFKEDKLHMDFYSQNLKPLIVKSADQISQKGAIKQANVLKPNEQGFEPFDRNSLTQPLIHENLNVLSPEILSPQYNNFFIKDFDAQGTKSRLLYASSMPPKIKDFDEKAQEEEERKLSDPMTASNLVSLPVTLRPIYPHVPQKKEKSYAARNYVFGTDNEPFILYVDRETLSCKVKPISWKLRLYNHQGAIRVSADEVVFAGGVNFLFNRVYEKTFSYNLKTKEIKKMANMLNNRFFATYNFFEGKIWAIGGRSYGEDFAAIMSECEVYNFQTDTWSLIPSLNKNRCQASSFVFNSKIYVAGGLLRYGKPTKSIEVFNAKRNRWEVMGIKMNEKLMGFIARPLNNSSLIIIGGTNFMPSYAIEHIDFAKGDLYTNRLDNTVYKHCLAKLVVLKQGYVIFGGINDEVEVFDKDFASTDPSLRERLFLDTLVKEYSQVSKESFGLTKCSYIVSE